MLPFLFYDDSLLSNQYATMDYRARNLSVSNLIPQLKSCTKYYVTLQGRIGSVWGNVGNVCTITLLCPASKIGDDMSLNVYLNPTQNKFTVLATSNSLEPITVVC